MLSLDKPGVYLMPSFITANGGSKVESFWSQFNGVPSGPGTGLELMHRLSRAYVLRKNLKAGVRNRGEYLRGPAVLPFRHTRLAYHMENLYD